MSFNGSGSYTPPAGNPVISGTLIQSAWANSLVSDIGSTFNNTLPRDGQSPMTGSLRVVDGSASAAGIGFAAEANTGLSRPANGVLAINVTSSEALRVNALGRVIIGKTTDDGVSKLQLVGNAAITGNLSVSDTATLSNVTTTNITANSVTTANLAVSTNFSVSSPQATFTSNVAITGNVVPTASNVYTLGSSTNWFSSIYGTSSQALYADLAERYHSDAAYEAGTVLVFGGDKEVTTTTNEYDHRVAGVVSTAPAYLMNSAAGNDAEYPAVALRGRVPVKVIGKVKKGDLLVTSSLAGFAQAAKLELFFRGFSVVAKSLEDKDTLDEGVVEAVIV